jgi:uncharacterized protein (TIGR02466 family)
VAQSADLIPESLDAAIRHHQKGELAGAKDIYESILKSDPNHSDALNLLGVVAHQMGDHDGAIRLIRKAIEINGSNAGYYNNLGESYRANGQYQDAVGAYENALRLNPGSPDFYNNLGIAYQCQQRFQEARAMYRRALELAPDDIEVLLNLGNLERECRRPAASIDCYRRVIRLAPGFAAGYASLGIALYELDQPEAAISAVNDAIRVDPLYLPAHQNLMKIRWFRGEHDRLHDSFRHACDRLPQSAQAHLNLGKALFLSRDFANAEAALQKAVALDPRSGEALNALGQVQRYLSRMDLSLLNHGKAVACAPGNALFREEYGITLITAGEFNRAVEELKRGHELSPRRSTILAHLIIALNETGDSSVARLVDYNRFVRSSRIEVPPGFSSLEEFNTALHEELKSQHSNPHHPMDQTMRGGTQSRNNLFQNPAGLVRVLKDRISAKVREFIQELTPDREHPFLRFTNPRFVFTGAWSTILSESGFDMSHVHNEGWMSGTYYIRIPEFDEAQIANDEGCLQFGEPNRLFASPRNATRMVIRPQVGKVVLFPSYYWHGVRPFTRNGVRHSVSFDLI